MFDIIRASGPFGVIIVLLVLLNLGLVVWTLVQLLGSEGPGSPALRNRINAVLFWGAVGGVLGLLGQANGIYLALRVISRAPEVSPPIVMEGFAISFLTTIMGLVFLLGSALAWMALRTLHIRRVPGAVPA